jgi:hypothetical protein
MATAKVNRTGDRQPSRRKRNLVLLVLLAAATVLGYSWGDLRQEARISTAYGARVACTCRYISNRALESCQGDLAAAGLGRTASFMRLSENAEAKTVSAGVPLLASQSAAYTKGSGCLLEPWKD